MFPTYRLQTAYSSPIPLITIYYPFSSASPIQCPFPRILQEGDASGIQSPLSFGGLGSLTSHLGRIVEGLKEALDAELLSTERSAINVH
jgi:hypothetical protein